MSETRRILVALSGGVDSATSAWLLREAGHEVEGVFLSRGGEDVSPGARQEARARAVAEALGIPLTVVDASEDFEKIIGYFCSEYLRGRTPNPCVLCNAQLKFRLMVREADSRGFDRVATGHYVRVDQDAGRWRLKRGLDATRDQSYYLCALTQEHLARAVFPLGERTKVSVRKIAAEAGIPAADSEESQDVCFVPGDDYRALVRERLGERVTPGDIVDLEGNVVGRHEGIVNFTVGQRRGVKVAMGKPAYVVEVDPQSQRVVLGSGEALLSAGCDCEMVNWVSIVPPGGPLRCEVQVRYRSKAVPATVTMGGPHRVHVTFDEPQRAVTPGQAAVFYDGDVVLGGGWISRTK